MIMEWKKVGATHHAHWRGVGYVLVIDEPTQRWHLTADGQKVKQHWSTLSKAMADIDVRQQRIILESAAQLVARGERNGRVPAA